MKTKREESILDIIATFEEMADIILAQLNFLKNIWMNRWRKSVPL